MDSNLSNSRIFLLGNNHFTFLKAKILRNVRDC
jgi:hypothetical protein